MCKLCNTSISLALLVFTCVNSQSYCEGKDDWCSEDFYASRNTYVTWLTATSIGTSLLLWYDKKLIFLLLLWYMTMMIFIYTSIFMLWVGVSTFDLLVYFLFYSNFNDDDEESSSDLDPFGEKVLNRLLNKIITEKLTKKRDENLKAQWKNKQKLQKEARKRKKEVKSLKRKKWIQNFKKIVSEKWKNLTKSIFSSSKAHPMQYVTDEDIKNIEHNNAPGAWMEEQDDNVTTRSDNSIR